MKDRRDFLKAVAGTGLLSAAAYQNILGANERIRIGFIGIGLIGKRHLLDFMAQPDVEVAAICEVYEPRLEEGVATSGVQPTRYKDFRRMLEDKSIDAVVVSTPDHWHALMTIMACAAGKDVYVEKPLTHVVREGQWMLDAERHYKRVVQVGTQQRSGEHYKSASNSFAAATSARYETPASQHFVISCRASPRRSGPSRSLKRIGRCGSGQRPLCLLTSTVVSITSVGSGITPAGKPPICCRMIWMLSNGR